MRNETMKPLKPSSSFSSSTLRALLFLLLCISCLCNNQNSISCIKTEKMALLRFKNDLIDDANRLSSWSDESGDCCRWFGVVCDNSTGHVHQLRLRGSDQVLRGTINPSLINLNHLTYLDLSSNDFGLTQIPPFIGSFPNLRYLNLSKSQFDGDIPQEIGNLSKLLVLDLQNGPVVSTLRVNNLKWLSNLPLLRYLGMSGIDLTGAYSGWLPAIKTLRSLSELHLSSCGLTQIPLNQTEVGFDSLTVLDLSNNNFDSLFPMWFFSLSKLVSLDLTSCLFSGLSPAAGGGFSNMSSLRNLYVSGNDFMNSSSVLKSLSSLKHLVSLDISTCSLTNPILRDLQNLTSLVYLDLSNNQINETIPKSLANLCNLNHLDLQANRLSGNLSELFERLCTCESPKIESMAFRGNYLFGQLPKNFGRLQNLNTIDLGYNSIKGTIPDSIGQLTLLKTFQINVNLLSGSIPDSIGSASSLEWIDLSYNQLNGSLPESMGQLNKLYFLSLYHNSLSGVLTEDHFANLTGLKTLRVEDNTLTLRTHVNDWNPPFQLEVLRIGSWKLGPRFPSWIRSQLVLTELDLANTGISDTLPNWFWTTFSGVTFLNISRNKIRGNLGNSLDFLASQAVMDLSVNRFKGLLPNHFNKPDLDFLDLSYNRLSGSLDQFLCFRIKEPRPLRVLNLANNNFSGVIPDCWKSWTSLVVLNFEKNSLSGKLPQSLGHVSSLESLDVRHNKLSGTLPVSLLNSKSLVIVELAENELVGQIPTSIGLEGTSLKLLSLRSNKLDGAIPDELCRLNLIQILDLAHNNLSGNIPTCLNNLGVLSGKERPSPIVLYDTLFQNQVLGSASLVTKGRVSSYSSILYLVTTIDLSKNNFSGSIPNELVALQGLRYLNLSSNHLSGNIPDKIDEMRLLESLDLSENHLSGKIPPSMSRLSSLNLLNLSFNELTGPIPMSTQLQSLNASSFIGNELCGAPLKDCEPISNNGNGKENYETHGIDWILVICSIVGCVFGFWVVVGPLLISKSWRNTYYCFIEKTMFKLSDAIRKGSVIVRKPFTETRSSIDVQQFDLSQYVQ